MTTPYPRFLFQTLPLLTVVACGTSDGSPNESSPDAGPHVAGPECAGPGYRSEVPLLPFERLTAKVVDTASGEGISDLRAQACGLNLCINSDSAADGSVFIEADDAELEKGAFKYGLGRAYVKFAYLLPSDPIVDIGMHGTVRLPEPETGVPLEAGRDVSSGGVTLSLSEEIAEIEIDPFDFDEEPLTRFRAVEIPVESAPPAVDPALGFFRLFGMTPVGTVLCPASTMTVENTTGLAPGTAVEFWLHGVEVDEEWAPYAGWAKVSDGKVSDDGQTISTDPDAGCPILGVIGIREAAGP